MPDRPQLGHAYGSAEDLPALLARIAPEPTPERAGTKSPTY
ncbi:hypothetical protein ACI2LO_13650 [Streptomyces sp. NPDC033754]